MKENGSEVGENWPVEPESGIAGIEGVGNERTIEDIKVGESRGVGIRM